MKYQKEDKKQLSLIFSHIAYILVGIINKMQENASYHFVSRYTIKVLSKN